MLLFGAGQHGRALSASTATHSSKTASLASNLAGRAGVSGSTSRAYKKSKARSTDRAFFWATTGLALCLMQFLQTVCTAFGNTFGVGAFVGLFSAAFNQTFLFQAITAAFGNSVTFLQAVSTAFNQAFLFEAVAAIFGQAFGVSAFVGVFRTVFSNSAFGIVTVLVFLRTAAGQRLVEVNGVGFDLWSDLFGSWQGKGAGSQDG
ncbi:Putative membrane protein [Pseudomonas [fluorescens] SBW25]|uniref:Membrane protein n=1 Tax=Pseudomonas fluorescens (strain SBW25) TaxID=216595 RepID=C3K4L8_PSEFS|nr:Putative membrane protein [Pseudomonas fluorescens SBW25]